MKINSNQNHSAISIDDINLGSDSNHKTTSILGKIAKAGIGLAVKSIYKLNHYIL